MVSPPKNLSSTTRLFRSSTGRESIQCVLERDQVDVRSPRRRFQQAQGHLLRATTPLLGRAVARVVHQDPPHQARGHAEKLGAVPPVDLTLIDQAEVGLVDERGGLQGMAGTLAAQKLARKATQLVVPRGASGRGHIWFDPATGMCDLVCVTEAR